MADPRRLLARPNGLDEAESVASFELQAPARFELAAVFRVDLRGRPEPTRNDEASEFYWWEPGSHQPKRMNPLDAEIVTRALD